VERRWTSKLKGKGKITHTSRADRVEVVDKTTEAKVEEVDSVVEVIVEDSAVVEATTSEEGVMTTNVIMTSKEVTSPVMNQMKAEEVGAEIGIETITILEEMATTTISEEMATTTISEEMATTTIQKRW